MSALPPPFDTWFAERGWHLHPHQAEMMDRAEAPALLLIAPTGGGKTLAGFLPSLLELRSGEHEGLHTLYVSPLKALASDIKRNLTGPVEQMGLPIRIEDRTGDTSSARRRRQRADPPHILLTTPESLALMLSYEDAPRLFAGLKRIIVDEIHALAESKRGDQLVLALSRLQAIVPGLRRVGLSATVEDPGAIAGFLARNPDPCEIVHADPGPDPDISILQTAVSPPWAGAGGSYAIADVLEQVRAHKTTLIFHNTRAQAEIFFHNLWLANEDALPIGIHHGSLSREQRSRVEQAMVRGELRAIVATGSLDLGIDWGNVDLVIQVGAPKHVKRLVQRIGRANHRYNAPSKALLIPANRFELVECVAALEAVLERDLDGAPRGDGPRDVLCQHIAIRACAGPFEAAELLAEIRTAGGYENTTRAMFDDCLDFVATGGYALKAYDRWQRLLERDGKWQLRDPRAAQRIRMNIGTIIDSEMLKVRLKGRGGAPLGEVEEGFAATLNKDDTFLIGGKVVRYEGLREMIVEVSPRPNRQPRIATYAGMKFGMTTQLASRVSRLLNQPDWPDLPEHARRWLRLQRARSLMPSDERLLIESFPHDQRAHTCIYGFAGRNAMQTLGLLLTARMERLGLHPLGFVATDYAVLITGLDPVEDPGPLLEIGDLREGFETWLAGNAVMKRTFKSSALIAGLVDRVHQGQRRSGKQATFSADILYDTLRRYDPEHLLLRITREEAFKGLVDFSRIEEMLARTAGRIDHVVLDRVSPMAAPLFLERGRVPVEGAGAERLLAEEAQRLMAAAVLETAGLEPGAGTAEEIGAKP
ncbi:ligase-associated DNA damage response DEXH box helicase [Profundibacterium mesophilum]|nr:ligase-associated DNA damage response DEXH box helicase [Profundibacterium mesophilum]